MDLEAEYRTHAADLVRYATVLVGPHDAHDVVNDVLATAIARNSLRAAIDVRAYLFGAVARRSADWHRAGSRRAARERRAAGRSSGEAPTTPDQARALLGELSAQQRAVVYLTYWMDWPTGRVAESLGVSDGTVKKQLARARDRLREVLGDERS